MSISCRKEHIAEMVLEYQNRFKGHSDTAISNYVLSEIMEEFRNDIYELKKTLKEVKSIKINVKNELKEYS